MTVIITPQGSIQSQINAYPLETDFVISGLHREQYIEPRSGITLRSDGTGELRGSRVVTGFGLHSPGIWKVPSPIAANQVNQTRFVAGFPITTQAAPRAGDAVELYFQGTRFFHADNPNNIANSDQWCYDYASNQIFIGRQPLGPNDVELSVTPGAINCLNRSNVVIDGLIIKHYVAPIQQAAIRTRDALNITIQNCTIEDCFSGAIKYGTGTKILNNRIIAMGQIGIVGTGDDVLIEGNEITGCNANGVNEDFEAGGLKASRSHRLTIRNNLVRENLGKGIWGDIDNGFFGACRITENVVLNNRSSGIFWEISFDCEIDNNYCRGNGTGQSTWMDESQIQVAACRNVNVHDNICVVDGVSANGIGLKQRSRGTGDTGVEWLNVNITVQDNIIVFLTTTYAQMFNGQFADYRTDLVNPSNLKWLGNITYVPSSRPDWFQWRTGGQSYTFSAWQALGYDVGGQKVVEDNPAVAAIPQWSPVVPPALGLMEQYLDKLTGWPNLLLLYDTQSLADPGRDIGPNNHDAELFSATDQVWLDQWAGADSFAAGALAAQCAGDHAFKVPLAARNAFNRNEFSIFLGFTLTGSNDYFGQAATDYLLQIGGSDATGFFLAYIRHSSGQLQFQLRISGAGSQNSYAIPSPAASWPPNTFQNFILSMRHSRSANIVRFDVWNGLEWISVANKTSPANGSGTTISGNRFTMGGYDLGSAGDDKYLVYGAVYNQYLDDTYLDELVNFPTAPPEPAPARVLFNIVPIIWKIRRRV